MADAWSTVVHREPEWDDRARNEAIGLLVAEQTACPSCGLLMEDVTAEMRREARNVSWGDGRKFEVRVYRCLGCMASTLIERDFRNKHKDHKEVPGVYSPTDGVRFRASQIGKAVTSGNSP